MLLGYIGSDNILLSHSEPLSLSSFKVVPHITDAIQKWIERVAVIPVDGEEGPADVCVIELGGTIGENNLIVTQNMHCISKALVACSNSSIYILHILLFLHPHATFKV